LSIRRRASVSDEAIHPRDICVLTRNKPAKYADVGDLVNEIGIR